LQRSLTRDRTLSRPRDDGRPPGLAASFISPTSDWQSKDGCNAVGRRGHFGLIDIPKIIDTFRDALL
jgi:hypothetical protein